MELVYSKFPSVLERFYDASLINHVGDSISTSGCIFTLVGGAVSWANKKQMCIAHSTMEAEFIALVSASKEAEWLIYFLMDIQVWSNPVPLVFINCDSETMLSRAYNTI